MNKDYKVKFKVLKDNKKDFCKKDKKLDINVTYPKYEAKAEFDGKTIEFKKHELGVTYTIIKFKNKIKINKRYHDWGEDYASIGKDLVILHYKFKGKRKIITEIEIIGA